jgi:small-conductance mechanosensitive channel
MLKSLWPNPWMRAIECRLDRIEAMDLDRRLGSYGTRLGRLEDGMASVQQLEAGLSALTQSVSDLSGRIAAETATLQGKIDQLQQQIAAGAQIPDADLQSINDSVAKIQALAQSSA